MRYYEDDINTAQEPICRAALLNDNAPDSLCHGFESNCGAVIFDYYAILQNQAVNTKLNTNYLFLIVGWREIILQNISSQQLRLKASSYFPAVPRPHGFSCLRTRGRVRTSTQHASKIAGNSLAPVEKVQRKLKFVQLHAACGLQQSMNRS